MPLHERELAEGPDATNDGDVLCGNDNGRAGMGRPRGKPEGGGDLQQER